MRGFFVVVVSVFALGCGKKNAKLSELSSDQLAEICGGGTTYSVVSRTCEPRLGEGVTISEQGQIVVDQATLADDLDTARAEGVASVDLIMCGEGTILNESEDRCRPALSEDVEIDMTTLLVVPTQAYADESFAAGVSSVTIIECGEGTTLDVMSQSCAPNLSERVAVSNGVIDVTDDVLQASFADGANSVQIVLCGNGTTLSEEMDQCEPILSDAVEVTEDGEIAPTLDFANDLRQEGVDSVEPIVCDDASGVILNAEGTACVARLSIDVYFDGNQIVPTQAYRDDIYNLGASQLSCGPGTTYSEDGLRCSPILTLALVQDEITGEISPSEAYETAAQSCGVTAANAQDGIPRTVILNEAQDGFECVEVLP